MKKKKEKRIAGFLLAFFAAASVLTGNAPALADTKPAPLKFVNSFNADAQLGVGYVLTTGIQVSGSNRTLTAVSSDSSTVSVKCYALPKHTPDYDLYEFDVEALKPGTATVTYSGADGAKLVQNVTIVSGVTYPGGKLVSDTTQNFSIQTGNSYFMKIHSIPDNGIGGPAPRLVVSDPNVVKMTWSGSVDMYNSIARIDAVGKPGQSCDLYLGAQGGRIKKLCRVTVTPHKGLTLDTNAASLNASEQVLMGTGAADFFPAYVLGKQDTYRFTAFTSSSVPPSASANNDRVSVKYLRKVSGGYEYQVTALKPGYSLARIVQNGETASFPLYVPDSKVPLGTIYPAYHSDTQEFFNMVPGETHTYQITVMGGSEPKFSSQSNSVIKTELVKKDNLHYDVNVTAVGSIGTASDLNIAFSNSPVFNNGSNLLSMISLVKVKSDTENDFSVRKYGSYMFKLTGATDFYPDTNGVFQTALVRTSGLDTYYKITAVGEPGQSSVFYMKADGISPKEVCTVTVASPIQIKSDTTADFSLKRTASYQFKITAPGALSVNFYCGTSGVFLPSLVKHSGDDFYFKITAVGQPGSGAGIYASVLNQPCQKLCAVSVR